MSTRDQALLNRQQMCSPTWSIGLVLVDRSEAMSSGDWSEARRRVGTVSGFQVAHTSSMFARACRKSY